MLAQDERLAAIIGQISRSVIFLRNEGKGDDIQLEVIYFINIFLNILNSLTAVIVRELLTTDFRCVVVIFLLGRGILHRLLKSLFQVRC